MKICNVYGLYSSARPLEIRYVGQTTGSIERRLTLHFYKLRKEGAKTACAKWIKKHLSLGNTIHTKLISIGDWNTEEIKQIQIFKNFGAQLLNHTEGGGGILGYHHSTKECKKVSKRFLGKKQTEEFVEKRASAHRALNRHLTRKGSLAVIKSNEDRAGWHHKKEIAIRISCNTAFHWAIRQNRKFSYYELP